MTYCHRHVETKLKRIAEHFPIVLVTGARQVGKSTLLAKMFPSVRCVTFDPLIDIEGARAEMDGRGNVEPFISAHINLF